MVTYTTSELAKGRTKANTMNGIGMGIAIAVLILTLSKGAQSAKIALLGVAALAVGGSLYYKRKMNKSVETNSKA